jgi:hypothetical protein
LNYNGTLPILYDSREAHIFFVFIKNLVGGDLYVSVPDIIILSRMMTQNAISNAQKDIILSIIYGGQDTPYNYHKTGFYFEYLQKMLENVGFCNIQRVESFGIFNDTSTMGLMVGDDFVFFSLNVQAQRCRDEIFFPSNPRCL